MTTRSVVGGTGVLLVVVGLSVMAGQLFESVLLVQLSADWAPMQFNTALCFVLIGAALFAARAGRPSVQVLLGALVSVFAFLVLVQFLFSVNLQIDQFFIKSWVFEPYVHPGRIPATVAALLITVGVAMAFAPRYPGLAFAVGVVVAVNGLLFVSVYVFGLDELAQWIGWSKVALHTAGALVVAGVGVATLAFYRGAKAPLPQQDGAPLPQQDGAPLPQQDGAPLPQPPPPPPPQLTRETVVPVFLFLVFAIAGVNLWQVLVSVELHRAGDETADAASGLSRLLTLAQRDRTATLLRMAHRIEHSPDSMTSGLWQHDAEDYIRDLAGVQSIGIYDARGPVVPAVTGQTAFELSPPIELLARAFLEREVIATPSLIIIPLTLPDAPQTALVASVGFSGVLKELLDDILPGFAITVSIDDAVLYERHPGRTPPRGTPIASFAIPGGFTDAHWAGRVWPEPQLIEGHRGPLPLTVLILSLIAASLTAIVSRSSRKLSVQAAFDRTVWSHSRDILCAVDADGRFVRVSESARTVWGYEPSELIGQSHLIVSVPDDRPEAGNIVADKRRVEHYVSRALRKDGTVFPMSWTAVWSEDLQLMIAIGRDIREHVEHETELERRVAERTHDLTLANAELEAFSYSVSHDLRTPLRAIAGFTEVLKEELPPEQLTESAQHVLNRVLEGTDRMARLIDDLLRLGQLSRRELDKRPVDLSALAHEVVARLRALEPSKDAEIRIQPGLMVMADVSLLELVLENLFGNAWKFTKDERPAVIEFSEQGGVFSIADNGVGFDMEYAGSLFGVFQRLHGLNEYSGTGIGLATVKRIIERHGGEVWANAEVGKGATFYFTLG